MLRVADRRITINFEKQWRAAPTGQGDQATLRREAAMTAAEVLSCHGKKGSRHAKLERRCSLASSSLTEDSFSPQHFLKVVPKSVLFTLTTLISDRKKLSDSLFLSKTGSRGQLLNSGQLFSVLALVRAGDCAVRARCHLRGRRACLSRSKPGGL